jgi:alanyl-tRNA synthetase
MMTSTQIRQSFLDFFKSKQHTIVPSSSLMPDSPNLLFTNAGMNQFVPIFLGQTKCPYTPGRAADTQKCIRAGGKHNDLEDVGLDTYHHTFFEMLGNWSFGDYFKKEAIAWAWELVVEKWKFPPERLYATVYSPDKSKNDPSEFDQEAWNCWAEKFRSVGLDPAVHIVNGNKKDNFWMMGETGPCGPCSELHMDLTPNGDTHGKLVNAGSPQCIEIWNLVFMQFNANPDGTFSPLPAQNVDTGMGFERVASIIQGTKGFKDFTHAKISNYETDIFRPIFDVLEKMSGKTYKSTLPGGQKATVGSATALAEPFRQLAEQPDGLAESFRQVAEQPGGLAEPFCQPAEKPDGLAEKLGGLAESSGQMAGKLRQPAESPGQDQIALDIAFRVIADHIRTLSFAIADGIQPGNNDRNYVLRRILRRAVRYGRTLGFHEPFFYKLVDVLADTMGDVFPEIRARKKQVQETIQREEEAFNKTLDTGIAQFNEQAEFLEKQIGWLKGELVGAFNEIENDLPRILERRFRDLSRHVDGLIWPNVTAVNQELLRLQGSDYDKQAIKFANDLASEIYIMGDSGGSAGDFIQRAETLRYHVNRARAEGLCGNAISVKRVFSGSVAFLLYDTYGFPLDLTELMARERGLTVDVAGFNKLMEEQRARARAAQKKEVISLSQIETTTPTKFVGYENLAVQAKVLEVVSLKDKTAVILDTSACYAEMGGQVGDTGEIFSPVAAGVSRLKSLVGADSRPLLRVTNTQKSGNTWLHFVDGDNLPAIGDEVVLHVDAPRRNAIQRHHTVTHLLHWALHEVASRDASQKGSFVGPDKLTFDFNSAPLTPAQIADIERLVNERIVENSPVVWTEMPYSQVKGCSTIQQFFGEKYGDTVRVLQIGGERGKLNGYSMELCGGTHVRATGEIGLFRIVGENAIAAGVRRIEAVAGLEAYRKANEDLHLIKTLAGRVNSPVHELDKKIEALLAHQKELEKSLRMANQKAAAGRAKDLLAQAVTVNGVPAIIVNLGEADGDTLQTVADVLKSQFKGVVVLGGAANGAVALVAAVSPEFVKRVQAGKIIQQIAPIVGGRGGGKPDNARGGGKDATKLDEALAKAKALLG